MVPEGRVQGLHTFSKADSQSQGQDSQELRYKFIAVSAHTFSSSHPENDNLWQLETLLLAVRKGYFLPNVTVLVEGLLKS